jgi:8-oxo-dGTP pyrophosphatase MutT (NUDIX family)
MNQAHTRMSFNKVPPNRIRENSREIKEDRLTQTNVQGAPAHGQLAIPTKQSVGIACIKFGKNNCPEILLVKKRYTYAYQEFVHGRYQAGDLRKNSSARNELMELFNMMTIEEKIDILSLDFDKIWYRVWLNSSKSSLFFVAKGKFESTFMLDNGVKLKKMIGKSQNGQPVWEIPKGRKKSKTEPDLICAIREFAEETNVSKRGYRFIPGIKKMYTHVDRNVRYTNTYYIAMAHSDIELSINFNTQDQINEIGDIRWMDIHAIRFIDAPDKRMETFIKPIFNLARKKRKIPT